MKHFNTNLENYLNKALQMNNYNAIVKDVITYLGTNSFTLLGLNNILEYYNINSVKSLKLPLMNIYCQVKELILENEVYIKLSQLEDLALLKQTCQIEEDELQTYKKEQLYNIYSMQQLSITAVNNIEEIDKRENLNYLKNLIGLEDELKYFIKPKQLNIPTCFS